MTGTQRRWLSTAAAPKYLGIGTCMLYRLIDRARSPRTSFGRVIRLQRGQLDDDDDDDDEGGAESAGRVPV